jgi:4a-hydroxytetrahydrobiopterin dehydratase
MTVLDDDTVRRRLADLPGWELRDGALHRELTFGDFAEAFAFMTRVALAAEKLDHHPDWSNSWNKVTLAVTSHSDGGVTERCIELAKAAETAAG